MKILCPYKCLAWGDFISNIWAAEYVSKHIPEVEILLDDSYCEGRFRAWNEMDWASDFNSGNLDSVIIKSCDYVLCTHHRHAVVYYDEPLKKIYFDAHGMIIKFVMEDWYPTFNATKNLKKLYAALKLPKEYISLHYSKCCFGTRNKYSWEEFIKRYAWIWNQKDIPVVNTGTPIEGCINLNKMQGIVKIYIMIMANKLYATQSGFTSISSMYRGRKKSYLIDTDLERVLEKSPPSVSFGNCNPIGDLKTVLYYLENGYDFSNYYDCCRNKQVTDLQASYPWFEVPKELQVPPDYQCPKLNLNIENGPRPINFNVEFEEVPVIDD